MRYAEGLFVGYRHYDRAGIAPLFPFGHGLGYAASSSSDFQADAGDFASDRAGQAAGEPAQRRARAEGSTVVQVYVYRPEAPAGPAGARAQGLRQGASAAGVSRDVALELGARDFALYDLGSGQWRVAGGSYGIDAGFSAGDILPRTAVRLEGAVVAAERPVPAADPAGENRRVMAAAGYAVEGDFRQS